MQGKWEPVSRRGKRVWSVLLVLSVLAVFTLYNWTYEAIDKAHIMPGVKKQDISGWVEQPELTDGQLRVLSEQTGVNRETLSSLFAQGRGQEVLELQEIYFAPVSIESIKTTPFTISEYLMDGEGRRVKGMPLIDIRDGDILITKNSRFLGWRNGHAGLVVDAEAGLVLEAIMLGTNTKLCSLKRWEEYPSFLVLRLKEDEDLAQAAADYAAQNLVDIPYQLLAGVWNKLFPERLEKVQAAEREEVVAAALNGTQCAHLVWYAYMQVGIDLDSDGGLIVTPYDIQNSPYLEVIQSYGY